MKAMGLVKFFKDLKALSINPVPSPALARAPPARIAGYISISDYGGRLWESLLLS
jgi:hypothetical protein